MQFRFPGMDPFLEKRGIWSGFHHSLAEAIKGNLNAQIGPKYYADVEVHTVMEDVRISAPPSRPIYPDVGILTTIPAPTPGATTEISPVAELAVATAEIVPAPIQRIVTANRTKLRFVKLYVTDTDEMVTSVEILSPHNKQGQGLIDYRRKRNRMLSSSVHMIELDFLRGGQRPGHEVNEPPIEDADYIVLVNRSEVSSRISEIWPIQLNDSLPTIPVPLLEPDPDVPLRLGEIINQVYTNGGYGWRIDYNESVPPPKLRPEMAEWFTEQLEAITD